MVNDEFWCCLILAKVPLYRFGAAKLSELTRKKVCFLNFRNGVKITSQFDAILLPSSSPSFSLNSAAIRLKRYLADAKIIGLKLETYFDTVPKEL